MSLVKIEGNASGTGTFTIAAPNSNTNRTLTLPDATGTIITTAGGAAISGTTGTFSGTISGGSTVGVGGATPSASGAGITFPATQSASTDANTLDDYEEGTWTPTLGGNTTYTIQAGKYTKVGNQVTAWFDLQVNAIGTGSTTNISGLPFTSANDGVQGRGVSIGYFVDLNTNVVCLTMRLDANSSSLNNATLGAAGASVSNATAIFKNGTRVTGTVTYNVS